MKNHGFKLEARSVSFALPDGRKILEKVSFLADGPSIALIGRNGSGKTTLLRILAGELAPSGGSVGARGRVVYLPQKIERAGGRLVRDLLGISDVLKALERIEAGDAPPEVIEEVEWKWDTRARCSGLLRKVGLERLSLDAPLLSLSGGELLRLAFCAAMLKEPDILLLDEPTNNLDRKSRLKLLAFLASWKGIKIIATHDRQLLESLDSVAEIYDGKFTLYRMRYPEYVAYRRAMNEAAELKAAETRKHLAKDRKQLGAVMDRRLHHTASAERRVRKDEGVCRLNLSSARSKGQATTAGIREIHLKRIEAAKKEFLEAKARVRPENRIEIDVPQDPMPAGKRIFALEDVNVFYGGAPLWKRPVSFQLSGNTRMALIGPNGSGKTTILRLLSGKLRPASGTVSVPASPVVYLDQFLEYLDPERTILENVWSRGAGMSESLVRTRLARLFFRRDAVHKKVACLSGGEKLRVALAKLFCAGKPPQLLLLDEPTNNMDLDSCEQLESALAGFKGAMLAVSHDYRFLNAIGAEDFFDLSPYCEAERRYEL
ncbi:MAG: putative ABC transporter ATP-binding protein [Elusimicrobia bacterium]|nr:MAG: putative ABC transporter ATP-binding protein [Elusimicrobiota bacterium]KAF0153700.1 MAG: putative ABC transporter ATP-binding protein [Elusimicrobiota bacterium]